jgi:hypothetical protein
MSARPSRIKTAIERHGNSVTIKAVGYKTILRPIASGQLTTYVPSSESAAWPRPIWIGYLAFDTIVSVNDPFVGSDFSGTVRAVIPVRTGNELIAKLIIISMSPASTSGTGSGSGSGSGTGSGSGL